MNPVDQQTLALIGDGYAAAWGETEQIALELLAARKLVALVRRWTSDHNMNGKPCHCLLCTGLERYERETAA